MVRGARTRPVSFDILPDECDLDQRDPHASPQSPSDHETRVLKGLPLDYQALSTRHRHVFAGEQVEDSLSEESYNLAKLLSPSPRRRPPIDNQTFEPLDKEQKESSSGCEAEDKHFLVAGHPTDHPQPSSQLFSGHGAEHNSPAATQIDHSVERQVKKQLAGQYEWVITYPVPARSTEYRHPKASEGDQDGGPKGTMVFGCNLLAQTTGSASPEERNGEGEDANVYAFIATPLGSRDAVLISSSEESRDLESQVNMFLSQPMAAAEAPRKGPQVEIVEQAASPSLIQVGERNTGYMDQSPQRGPATVPLIEDSLEELDRLEEEIEAVSAVTTSRRTEHTAAGRDGDVPPDTHKQSAKRVRIVTGQSATVRVKPSQPTKPALRRSSSLTLREKKTVAQDVVAEPKAMDVSLSRPKSTTSRPADHRTPVKSTKPLTVPSFRLPGEAVAQRLKEQREARKAQQAEAQKANAIPPRPTPAAQKQRSIKAPTRPNFELPGEAISRRKREEREARLKAQEEEERKRREFKARPIRHSLTPKTVPRETIASLARQRKSGQGDTPGSHDTNMIKRLATSNSLERLASATSAIINSPQSRGRNSIVLAANDGSRGTSVSTSVSEKRSSVSLEEVAQQRARGKEIFARDNSYSREREREKRDRELAAKLAREQAAERSRAASREWAERQRQKKLGQMDATRRKAQARA